MCTTAQLQQTFDLHAAKYDLHAAKYDLHAAKYVRNEGH